MGFISEVRAVVLFWSALIGWLKPKLPPRLQSSRYRVTPKARFKALYPCIKKLAVSPLSHADIEELRRSLNALKVRTPYNLDRWPGFLRYLVVLSKNSQLREAQDIPDYMPEEYQYHN